MTEFQYINLDKYDAEDRLLEIAYQLKRIADVLIDKASITPKEDNDLHTTKEESSTK